MHQIPIVKRFTTLVEMTGCPGDVIICLVSITVTRQNGYLRIQRCLQEDLFQAKKTPEFLRGSCITKPNIKLVYLLYF